jgi:hypothetical protein
MKQVSKLQLRISDRGPNLRLAILPIPRQTFEAVRDKRTSFYSSGRATDVSGGAPPVARGRIHPLGQQPKKSEQGERK